MPKNVIPNRASSVQDIQDQFFPKKNWLPPINAVENKPVGNRVYVPVNRIIIFGSCTRCGCAVEQAHWRNHINYHMNATRP